MATGDLVADLTPPHDGWPAWMIAVGSIVSTIAAWRAWGPIGAWIGRRLDLASAERAAERQAVQMQRSAYETRLETRVGELETDLRESQAVITGLTAECATLQERAANLTREAAEDKAECRQAIADLRRQIAALRKARPDVSI